MIWKQTYILQNLTVFYRQWTGNNFRIKFQNQIQAMIDSVYTIKFLGRYFSSPISLFSSPHKNLSDHFLLIFGFWL